MMRFYPPCNHWLANEQLHGGKIYSSRNGHQVLKYMLTSVVLSCVAVSILMTSSIKGEETRKTREQKVREDRSRVEATGYWIYNDLVRGFDEARRTGKPMIVVLRCLPCEECVKLDDELMDNDPELRALLDQFVRVRVVGTNGLDLSLFQFDTDQSFAAFLLNADRTIYGRFGTRSHRTEWGRDVSLPGLARALEGALELHKNYPAHRESLTGKIGPQPEFSRPELLPALEGKYTSRLNYEKNVVQSCIHCHQIGDAIREQFRSSGKAIPEQVLFPYPHPKSIGLELDPHTRGTIRAVANNSPAQTAGFQPGDQIATMDGQPILSMADVQWVLHLTNPSGGTVLASVQREGQSVDLTMKLTAGWRQLDDISWRASAWGLRRMVTGGLVLEQASLQEREGAGLAQQTMALRVEHVGMYGEHAAGKNAGFLKDDIIVEYDGHRDPWRESDLFFYGVTHLLPGTKAVVKVRRGDQTLELVLPMQP